MIKFELPFKFLVIFVACLGIASAQVVFTDYEPATKALNYLNTIRDNYNMFQQRIEKNLSIEYSKCVNSIKELKCQNIDQWQSVIEELKLEIDNSETTEVPFLVQRKDSKVIELEFLLNKTSNETDMHSMITEQIRANQQSIMNKMYYIQSMYKLPTMPAFIQEGEDEQTEKETNMTNDVVRDLNADVPDIAKTELGQAKEDYEIADLSIQAQTTSNMLKNYAQKSQETLDHLDQTYTERLEDMMAKKLKLKEDILKVRQLLMNENKIKQKNEEKIADMESKIEKCRGKPTNIEKDCEPLRVEGSKILTEIDIVKARTIILHKEVSKLLLENYTPEQLKEIFTQQIPKPQPLDENELYLSEPSSQTGNSTEVEYSPREPQELYPIYHYREQIEGQEQTNETSGGEQEQGTGENPQNETEYEPSGE